MVGTKNPKITEVAGSYAGNIGGLEWLPVQDLLIEDYQRELKVKRVRELTRTFDINMVGTLKVSLRNGGYYIMDGQHRKAAAEGNNVESLPCLVYIGLSYEDEAILRRAFNNAVKDSATDVFRLRLAAEEPQAKAIKRIVESSGFELDLTSRASQAHASRIGCVGALDYIWQRGGDNDVQKEYVLRRCISVAVRAWPGQPKGWSAAALRGIKVFFTRFPGVSDNHLVQTMRRQSVEDMYRMARVRSKEHMGLGSIPTHFAFAMYRLYNHNRRGTTRLVWDEQATPEGVDG